MVVESLSLVAHACRACLSRICGRATGATGATGPAPGCPWILESCDPASPGAGWRGLAQLARPHTTTPHTANTSSPPRAASAPCTMTRDAPSPVPASVVSVVVCLAASPQVSRLAACLDLAMPSMHHSTSPTTTHRSSTAPVVHNVHPQPLSLLTTRRPTISPLQHLYHHPHPTPPSSVHCILT